MQNHEKSTQTRVNTINGATKTFKIPYENVGETVNTTPRPVGGKAVAPWEPLQNLVKKPMGIRVHGKAHFKR